MSLLQIQFDLLNLHSLRGRERALPVHADGNAVFAAFQARGGDEELNTGELLRGEVSDERSG